MDNVHWNIQAKGYAFLRLEYNTSIPDGNGTCRLLWDSVPTFLPARTCCSPSLASRDRNIPLLLVTLFAVTPAAPESKL
jgi:hypothetical protein